MVGVAKEHRHGSARNDTVAEHVLCTPYCVGWLAMTGSASEQRLLRPQECRNGRKQGIPSEDNLTVMSTEINESILIPTCRHDTGPDEAQVTTRASRWPRTIMTGVMEIGGCGRPERAVISMDLCKLQRAAVAGVVGETLWTRWWGYRRRGDSKTGTRECRMACPLVADKCWGSAGLLFLSIALAFHPWHTWRSVVRGIA